MSTMKFQKIFLEFTMISKNTEDVDIQKAIKLAEESVCPVWQMLKNNVEVITSTKFSPNPENKSVKKLMVNFL